MSDESPDVGVPPDPPRLSLRVADRAGGLRRVDMAVLLT
jgi:hypothetical protein